MVVSRIVKFSLILFLFSFQNLFAQELIAPVIKEYKASYTNVDLVWNDQNYHGIRYRVYRSNNGSSGWTQIATVNYKWTPYYSDNIGYSTKRYYRVSAYDPSTGASSGYSNVVSVTTPSAPRGKIYYVDAVNGNDNNPGTSEGKAWKSINKVNSSSALFTPGTRVLFKRGQTWYGGLYLIWGGGSSGNPVIFDTYGSGEKPVIRSSGNKPPIQSTARDYYVFRNFHVIVTDRAPYGIYVAGLNSEIEHCFVENKYPQSDLNTRGIRTPNPGIKSVKWNKVTGFTIQINVTRGINIDVAFNYVYNNNGGKPNDQDALQIGNTAGINMSGTRVRYNHITGWGDDAIDSQVGPLNITYEYNYIHNPKTNGYEGSGFKLEGTGHIVRYNVIHSLNADGSSSSSGGNGISNGIQLKNGKQNAYGNLVWDVKGGALIVENGYDNYIYNNTLISNRSAIGIASNTTGTLYIRNNILNAYGTGISSLGAPSHDFYANGRKIIGGYNILVSDGSVNSGNNYSGKSYDLYNKDPLFMNTTKNDYRLKSNSPCIGAGVSFSVFTIDLCGISIGKKPPIGALQSSGTVIGNPPMESNLVKIDVVNLNASSYINNPNKTIDGKDYSDGDNSSRWTTSQSKGQWITYDLGSLRSMTNIKISFYGFNNNIKHKYQILASRDNKSWYYIVSSATSKLQEWNVWKLPGTNMRYIKVFIDYVDGASTPSIWEIEFWGESSRAKEGNADAEIELEVETPEQFELSQNYPNPFNPTTAIKYSLPVESQVKLTIYNALGEVVTELVNQVMNMGFHEINWNASGLASGMYIYSLEVIPLDGTSGFKAVKKMSLVK